MEVQFCFPRQCLEAQHFFGFLILRDFQVLLDSVQDSLLAQEASC